MKVAVLGSILTHVYRDQMAAAIGDSGYLASAGDSIMAAQQLAAGLPEPGAQTLRGAASDAFLTALHLNTQLLTAIMLVAAALIAVSFGRRSRR